MMPAFLEDLHVTEDGYLWMQSQPEQQKDPAILPASKRLWGLLHPHYKTFQRDLHVAPPPPAIEDLWRSPNLWETVRGSLTEIEQMKVTKPDKSLRLSVNRLKKQQTNRLNLQDVNEKQAYADATLRTVRTLNSMRALFPLLDKMIRHEQMHNAELEINVRDEEGKVIGVMTLETLAMKKKKRRQRDAEQLVWILGDYVYDTATKLHIASITERMWHVLQCFVPESQIFNLMNNKSSSDSWATVLPQILQEQRARRITPLPDSLFVTERKEQVQSIAETCDETYLNIFHHENAEAQHARGLYQQAVDRLVRNLRSVLQCRDKGAEIRVYGSCLSNLSLGKSSDVDISLHLPAAAYLKEQFASGSIEASQYERVMKNHVYRINSLLAKQHKIGFRMQECVTRARVPVIKGTYLFAGNPYSPDGSVDFDICFSNEIAAANSALLSEYTLVDERVKRYLLGIKAWAKNNAVSSAAENRISSYAWVNLGIFYLQCIRFVPNFQCRELMLQHGFCLDPANNWQHRVDDLETGYLPWDIVAAKNIWKQPAEFKETPVTLLLYGFFHFYAKQFPRTLYAVSIREGEVTLPRSTFEKAILSNLCIEDPFETYCSHFPHDLGRPANESGHRAISDVFVDAEKYLRGVLEGGDHSAEHSFWRLSKVAETSQVCANQRVVMPPPVMPPPMNPPRQNQGRGNRHVGHPKQRMNSNRAQYLYGGPSLHPSTNVRAIAPPPNQGRGRGRGPRGSVSADDKSDSADPSKADPATRKSVEHPSTNVRATAPPPKQGRGRGRSLRGSVTAKDKTNSAHPSKVNPTTKHLVEHPPTDVRATAPPPNQGRGRGRGPQGSVKANDKSNSGDPSEANQTKKNSVDPSKGGETKQRHSPPRKNPHGGRGQRRSGKDRVNNSGTVMPVDNNVRRVPSIVTLEV